MALASTIPENVCNDRIGKNILRLYSDVEVYRNSETLSAMRFYTIALIAKSIHHISSVWFDEINNSPSAYRPRNGSTLQVVKGHRFKFATGVPIFLLALPLPLTVYVCGIVSPGF